MKLTPEEKFWSSNFGNDYNRRNYYTDRGFDASYVKKFGVSRSAMNFEFIKGVKPNNILEVGSNIGLQLSMLQSQGFNNLYGVEINENAVELSKKRTKNVNIILGSGFDLPFRDNYFDLVFTSGLLIHINPKDVKIIMGEIYRTSKKYIWGFEYYADKCLEINYRGNNAKLWKADFASMFLRQFPDLVLVRQKKFAYVQNPEYVDCMYLLRKK